MELSNIKLSPDGKFVTILDQTQLPNRIVYENVSTAEAVFDAIKNLKVRGAPAIGIFGAMGLCVCAREIIHEGEEFYRALKKIAEYINCSRPTAVNLSWGLERMLETAKENLSKPRAEIMEILKNTAFEIQNEDIEVCKKISEYGLELVKDGDGILTHCNAGPLATSKYGTGLGAIILGQERGMHFRAYVDETRPLLQGARITALELKNAGADVTLICDNMASAVMKEGKVNAVFVGCDRVASNGDTANKIGTSGVSIIAKHYNLPVYVFCPTSTIDMTCKTGKDIRIEYRNGDEIRKLYFAEPVAPEVNCFNPSFDVTDNSLISAIVTEKGICYPPFCESLKKLFE